MSSKKITDLPTITSSLSSDVFVLMQGTTTLKQTRSSLLGGLISTADLQAHSSSVGGHPTATTASAGFMSSTDKTKLDGISSGAQANQNTFSNFAVSGQSTVTAATVTDTTTLIGGSGLSITTNAGTKAI